MKLQLIQKIINCFLSAIFLPSISSLKGVKVKISKIQFLELLTFEFEN